MLEERFAKELIRMGVGLGVSKIEFSEKAYLIGNIGPFKVKLNFAQANLTVDPASLIDAIVEGEGDTEGTSALNLLDRFSGALNRGEIAGYELGFFSGSVNGKEAMDCDRDILFINDKGVLRVDYKKSEQEGIISQCEKGDGQDTGPCNYRKVCPTYIAHKKGKNILYEK